MKEVSAAIRKSRQFEAIVMTTSTSSKKHITQITNHLKQLASNQGLASLSASQIGHQFSMFVVLNSSLLKPYKFTSYNSKSTQYSAFINPKILDYSVSETRGWEECPSYPNFRFMIKRSTHIITEYQKTFKDRKPAREEFKGFQAVLFQHQYTHAQCINLFDIAEDVQLTENSNFPDTLRYKLKEEFTKFKIQRDQSQINKVRQNYKLVQIQIAEPEMSESQKQSKINALSSFSYNQAKSLRDFIEFEIIDPV